jgi:hypothetical protein
VGYAHSDTYEVVKERASEHWEVNCLLKLLL